MNFFKKIGLMAAIIGGLCYYSLFSEPKSKSYNIEIEQKTITSIEQKTTSYTPKRVNPSKKIIYNQIKDKFIAHQDLEDNIETSVSAALDIYDTLVEKKELQELDPKFDSLLTI